MVLRLGLSIRLEISFIIRLLMRIMRIVGLWLIVSRLVSPREVSPHPSLVCVLSRQTAKNPDTYTSVESFHESTFFPKGPAQHLRLLTRTVGPDRIVDEALLSFSHTAEIPWLLPGVQPSNQPVCIPVVLAAGFCTGGLAQLDIYWDQASVLAQVGALEDSRFPVNRGEFKSLIS